jgi:peptide/nickel transport system substrate-binding protein
MGAGAMAGASLLSLPAIGQSAGKSTLRFVPETDLSVLDPIFSPVTITQNHGYHVYDTLYGVDDSYAPKPQMAAGHTISDDGRTWEFKLRDGLKFHDGEPVRAVDCAVSMERWSKRDAFGQQLATAVDSWEAVDDKTLRVNLKRPYPLLLDAIAQPSSNGQFIMPERIAQTDAFTAITDATGSGPFKFLPDEYVSGSRVVYEKFADYVPRDEPAQRTAGGKVAHFDRIEWHIIPDKATSASAIRSGEVDWLEYAENDLLPLLATDPRVKLEIRDPGGRTGYLRFNVLYPPFDNPAIRRVVLESVNEQDFIDALSGGDSTLSRECFAMFPCGFPFVKELGSDFMRHGDTDLDKQKAALKAAGYNNEKVVILAATDIGYIMDMAQIAADLLKKIGMNVDLQTMDWGTMAQRRGSMEPLDNGGWSLFPTAWPSVNVANPAINVLTRGVGKKGYVGWFESEKMQQLIGSYTEATTDDARQAAFDAVQNYAFEVAPNAPTGMFFQRAALGKDIEGFIPGWAVFPWNIKRV